MTQLRPALFKVLFTRREGYPSVTLAFAHFGSFFLRRVYKAARVTRVGGLPYLRARVTLEGGLTISFVNTPGRVRLTFVSRPFECDHALNCVKPAYTGLGLSDCVE